MEINGKKVVVIGGASGMGRASAELLAARGASVAVLDREGSDGKDVAAGIGGEFYPVDVTDFAGTEETLQTAVDKLGGLHVTVTTAGGGIAKRTMSKSGPHDLESFQSVIDLNLIASFNISRLAASYMSQQRTRRRGARRHHQHRVDRGVRGPDRAGRLHRRQSRHRRHVPDHGTRPRVAGHPRIGHRAKPVRDRVDQGHSGRIRQRADQRRGVPEASGTSGGVRQAGRGHRGQPDAERPVPATGRRSTVRAQVMR